jgi:N-acetylglucosamine-6-sulfatase
VALALLALAPLTLPPLAQKPAASAPVAAPRPNFIIIVVDDLRWDEIGAAGHPFARTPHIDRIAREGILFRNAFATTPLCSPSRASFLTGMYAHRHGIIDNTDRSAASHRLVTFPLLLNRAGYDTAFLGKWHMGNDDTPRPGFDYWVSFKGQGQYIDPELAEGGRTSRVPGYITDILTARAITFLRQPRSRPFVLYLAHKAAHPNIRQHDDGSTEPIGNEPFVPAERHRHLYDHVKFPRRPNYGKPPLDKPALLRTIGDLPPLGPATATEDSTIIGRQRALAAVDDGLGEILRELEASGQLANTMLVFTGDHGYFYGEHGLNDERRLAYEESIRIPLVARYPARIRPGSTAAQMALSIDMAPTVLELAGVAAPQQMQGRSLVPLFRGPTPQWRSSFLVEYYSDTVFPRILKMGYQSLRTERWKYIRYRELQNMDELYDLRADPYEMRNLIAAPRARAELPRLQRQLDRLLPAK